MATGTVLSYFWLRISSMHRSAIVWKKHLFQGLAADDAEAIITEFAKLSFAITPAATLLDDAYRLAVTHHRTVYDSLYLALAIRESCQFVTAVVQAASVATQDLTDEQAGANRIAADELPSNIIDNLGAQWISPIE